MLARSIALLVLASVSHVPSTIGHPSAADPTTAAPARPADRFVDLAIDAGLAWLCRHQNPDGSWGFASLRERCKPGAECFDPKGDLGDRYDPGLTGLALLAFLRRGWNDATTEVLVDPATGELHALGEVVRKGLRSLVARQSPDGFFTQDRSHTYNEAIATLALAEAFAATHDPAWQSAVQKAVEFLQASQRPSPRGEGSWGWRYASRREVESQNAARGAGDAISLRELCDSDVSVTYWAVTALEAAAQAGLVVDRKSLEGALAFCQFATPGSVDKIGLVGYQSANQAGQTLSGKHDHFLYHPMTLSAAGIGIRLACGAGTEDTFLEPAARRLISDLPVVSEDRLSIDYTYWHHGTAALRRVATSGTDAGADRSWTSWKREVVPALTALQDGSKDWCRNGGWIQGDRWAYAGGPVYTTAISVLTLERATR